jgi:predicted metal-dependent phosphoesterase TrpH
VIVEAAHDRQVDVVAITDHDEIRGLRARLGARIPTRRRRRRR